jgi:hypothetical protein
MILTRSVLAASSVMLVLLSGCSSDSEPESGDAPSAQNASPPEEGVPANQDRRCRADVVLTGAVEMSWKGEAESRTSGSGAVYRAEKGETVLTVYSETDDFGSSINLRDADSAFATRTGEAEGIDAARSGKRASVDTDIEAEGGGVHVVAAFTC